jgi:hypothetical protein
MNIGCFNAPRPMGALAAVAFVAALGAGSPALAAPAAEGAGGPQIAPKRQGKHVRYEKAIEVPARAAEELSVVNRLGSVKIVGWDRKAVQVRAIKQAPTTRLGERLRVRVASPRGRRISVRTYARLRPALPPSLQKKLRALMWRRLRSGRWDAKAERRALAEVRGALVEAQRGSRRQAREDIAVPLKDARVDLELYVPRTLAVRARTFKHDIVVSGCRAGTRLSTEAGKVVVRDVRGKVRSYAQSGAQRLTRIAGNVDVQGGSAPVRLSQIRGRVRAVLTAGDIDARGLGAQSADLRTIGGNIKLDVERARNRRKGKRRQRRRSSERSYRLVTLAGTVTLFLPKKLPALEISGRVGSWLLGSFSTRLRQRRVDARVESPAGQGRGVERAFSSARSGTSRRRGLRTQIDVTAPEGKLMLEPATTR